MKMYQYIITQSAIMITDGTEIYNINKDHHQFRQILDNILAGDFEGAISLTDSAKAIKKWSGGNLEISGNSVLYKGNEVTNKLVDRILSMMDSGDNDFERYALFLDKVLEQQSYQTRERIMDFVACGSVQLAEDGDVIAFKNVREDYFDKHSGTFRNMIGDTPQMPRSEVDDDHQHTCSKGLHVCSAKYLKSFWGTSGRTMLVHVDPRDFVAIPYDYEDSKARVCEYVVVEEVTDCIDKYL